MALIQCCLASVHAPLAFSLTPTPADFYAFTAIHHLESGKLLADAS